ncbi:hydroxymethylpyrimidine/phosphomethylpyrimidine kinase [uncultured Fibrobacter sp.]|uniref:hydroxymethylpyrimidine/phosphomethylpyrimidine kinase n=1 Tax=uncultured Fibrobacter sp. TaxID=261512 RepID=UPI0025FAC1F4|nr:hydroxymethylpyrimidine/phosphomethylpyrimidine kinase [uncultured Fibrobacter sp.]
MAEKLTYALTIGGFDGSAGAGILADVKAMAHFGVYAQSVCTALTEQNEDEFVAPGWIIWERIEAQLDTLFRKHTFEFVKIGLVEKPKILKRIVDYVREKSPKAFIVWDPIASASAGYHFMRGIEQDDFLPIMSNIDLVTPNAEEFALLGLGLAASRDQIELGKDFAILLKGGHSVGGDSVDTLWAKDGKQYKFSSPRIPGDGKHGTGCNLSSAIVANLALGKSLTESCQIAKNYMDEFIKSGEGRLGFISSSAR